MRSISAIRTRSPARTNFITFKSVVRTIAARDGLFASFMPKPFPDKSGSGMHINLSLFKDGINLFTNRGNFHSPVAHSFIAGVMRRIPEITLFLNPTGQLLPPARRL